MDINGLYDSLLDCSFRGVIFTVPDSRHEVGRRTQRFFFPGRDTTSFQDLGAMDGPIRIKGLIVGTDYIHQGRRIATALRAPGAGTLVHPWLGELQVVLIEPATINFDLQKSRLVSFEAVFARIDPDTPSLVDTLTGLLDAADNLKAQARALLRNVLAPVALALAVVGYVGRFASRAATMWTSIAGGALTGIVASTLSSLPGVGGLVVNNTYADKVADQTGAVPAALARASNPLIPAAVGAGGDIATPAATDPRETARTLLAGVTGTDVAAIDPTPGPAMAVAAQAMILAALLSTASDIPFTSSADAIDWRDVVSGGLDLAATRAATLASTQPTAAGGLWRGLVAARSAWQADMNTIIGRLPNVVTVTLPSTVPAWLVAQYLAGDRPDQLLAMYRDLISRNDVRHPAMVPAGPIEVLDSAA